MKSNIQNPAAYERATRARIIENAQKTFIKTYDRANEVIIFLMAHEGRDTFLGKMCESLQNFGKLTEKQYESVCKIIDDRAANAEKRAAEIEAKRANSAHVGTVGKKATFRCVVEKVIEFHGESFSYYDSGLTFVYLMRDAAGNRIVYKTKGDFAFKFKESEIDGYMVNYERIYVAEGMTVEFTASVKEHSEYKGERQTAVQRAKVVSLEW